MDTVKFWLRVAWHMPLIIAVACLGSYLGWLERRSGRWVREEIKAREK